MHKTKNICILFQLVIIFSVSSYSQDTIPPLNRTIVQYVTTVIGKKVDRGECWDIANQALNRVGASWDHKFKYGKLLNYKKDTIYPGDIIQFKNVLVEYKSADGLETTRETMGQHTAIVYKVYAFGDLQLAHQNTEFSGRKVGLSRLVLKNIKRGKIFIYRPEK
jgi:hypothetical protein